MKTKTLLLGVGGIFLLALVAYFVLSPIAAKKIEEEFAEFENDEIVATSTEEIKKEATSTEVKTTEVKTTTATKPVTTQQPTQTSSTPTTPAPVVQEEVKTGFTSSEVAQHSTESSCWSIINGGVYDLTAYVPKHPGGASKIIRICGKDGSSAFEGQHGGESRPEAILQKYWIGNLI